MDTRINSEKYLALKNHLKAVNKIISEIFPDDFVKEVLISDKFIVEDEILTLEEAAKIAKVSKSSLLRYEDKGLIIRNVGARRILKSDLFNFFKMH